MISKDDVQIDPPGAGTVTSFTTSSPSAGETQFTVEVAANEGYRFRRFLRKGRFSWDDPPTPLNPFTIDSDDNPYVFYDYNHTGAYGHTSITDELIAEFMHIGPHPTSGLILRSAASGLILRGANGKILRDE